MDFTEFLNSKDIAEHLRKINYELSPEETLYVIHGSRNRTLSEQREAYFSLLARFPDYKLRERRFGAFKNHTLESFSIPTFKSRTRSSKSVRERVATRCIFSALTLKLSGRDETDLAPFTDTEEIAKIFKKNSREVLTKWVEKCIIRENFIRFFK